MEKRIKRILKDMPEKFDHQHQHPYDGYFYNICCHMRRDLCKCSKEKQEEIMAEIQARINKGE